MSVPPLDSGDRAHVIVRGFELAVCQRALDLLRTDPKLLEHVVPAPSGNAARRDQFGDVSAFQDFIVAVGGGLSVEALAAAIRSVFTRSKSEQRERHEIHAEVHFTSAEPGQVVVTITVTTTRDD